MDNNKRIRRKDAIELPVTIKNIVLPKYIVYYKECYNKEKALYREFFKIEKHPNMKLNKVYISSKSNKISITEKLEQITYLLKKLESQNLDLSNNILDTSNNILDDISNIKLSKYWSIKNYNEEKYYICFDKKTPDKRFTMKKIFTKNVKTVSENIEEFKLLLIAKNYI